MREFELKFQVPPQRRADVERALRKGAVTRQRLQARYFDTPQGALERAAMVLRLRKEGRRWVQTVKCTAGRGLFDRLEHEAPAASPIAPDLSLHDGSEVAPLLAQALAQTGEDASALQPVFATDVVRLARTVSTAQTAVELALDQGRITVAGRELPVLELEFELKAGVPSALIELTQDWCAKYGLWLDPQSKAMAGRRLAAQEPTAPAVTASPIRVPKHAGVADVLTTVLGSVLEQVLGNAREVAAGNADDKHVHQLRVGLRRLRSALRELHALPELASLPAGVEETLTAVFRRLGEHRDALVLVPELERQLAQAGAPPLARDPADVPDIGDAVRDPLFQAALLEVIALQHRLQEGSPEVPTTTKSLRKTVTKRMAKLYVDSLKRGDEFARLAEPDRHRIRKRLKRLRYLSELMRPLYPGRKVDGFVDALKHLQDALGQYQDAAVGRRLWDEQAKTDPAAWFGAGWLAARAEELARSCERACRDAVDEAVVFWKR
jgi:triphosphatase